MRASSNGRVMKTRMKFELRDTQRGRDARKYTGARHPRNNKARIISPLIRPDAMPVRSACVTTCIRVCATATYVCVNRARRLTRRARRYLLTCYVFVRRTLPCTRYKRGEGGTERRLQGGKASRSCWRTLVLLASMNIFMSGEHGAGLTPTSFHPFLVSPSSFSICSSLLRISGSSHPPAISAAVIESTHRLISN